MAESITKGSEDKQERHHSGATDSLHAFAKSSVDGFGDYVTAAVAEGLDGLAWEKIIDNRWRGNHCHLRKWRIGARYHNNTLRPRRGWPGR